LTVGDGQQSTRSAPGMARAPETPARAVHAPTRIGELLGGKYRISRLIAQGGMGVVYEAQHEIVRRRFAVKFLLPDYARRRESLARFHREAEAAGALENEHIASAVDFGIATDGSPFIVMEYLVGENLAALLDREGRLCVGRATHLCVQACQGAEAAHAAGILHRDLKPKNLFVGRRDDGTDLLKILDFGIAKLQLVRYDHTTTDTGTLIGTPAYMSPEQARGERALDARSDVYALGTILFEMLSGELPHPGNSPNAVLYHISTKPAFSLGARVPGLPSALVEIVDRTLATDPGARPQSAAALALGLAPFVEHQVWPSQSSEATPAVHDEGLAQAGQARPRRPRGARVAPQRLLWSRIAIPIVLVGAIVAVAAGTFSIRSRKPVPSPTVVAPATPSSIAPPTAQPPPPSAAAVSAPAAPPDVVPSVPSMDSPDRVMVEPAFRKRSRVVSAPGPQRHKRPAGSPTQSGQAEPVPQSTSRATRHSKLQPDWDHSDIYDGLVGAGSRP
jgi:serine/threonine protein kinase